jgi:hypothetical protein
LVATKSVSLDDSSFGFPDEGSVEGIEESTEGDVSEEGTRKLSKNSEDGIAGEGGAQGINVIRTVLVSGIEEAIVTKATTPPTETMADDGAVLADTESLQAPGAMVNSAGEALLIQGGAPGLPTGPSIRSPGHGTVPEIGAKTHGGSEFVHLVEVDVSKDTTATKLALDLGCGLIIATELSCVERPVRLKPGNDPAAMREIRRLVDKEVEIMKKQMETRERVCQQVLREAFQKRQRKTVRKKVALTGRKTRPKKPRKKKVTRNWWKLWVLATTQFVSERFVCLLFLSE